VHQLLLRVRITVRARRQHQVSVRAGDFFYSAVECRREGVADIVEDDA
jgi:hypothetical protein